MTKVQSKTQRFPIYYHFGYDFKLISEQEYTKVCTDRHEIIISHCNNDRMIETIISQGKEITKEEFETVYNAALSEINRRAFEEVSEPATDQDIREELNAESEEISIHEMAEL